MANKKSPKKSKGKAEDVQRGGRFPKLLPVEIDSAAARKKESEIRELLTANVDLKEKAKPFNDKRKQNTERIDKLRQEVESLTEEREVQCREEYDFKHRVVKTRRLDTNKLVPELERTMQDGDRQENLLGGKRGQKHKLPNPVISQEAAEKIADKMAEKSGGDASAEGEEGDEPEERSFQ